MSLRINSIAAASIVCSVAVSLIVALGLGPIAMSGLGDIVDFGASEIAITNVVVITLVIITTSAIILALRRFSSRIGAFLGSFAILRTLLISSIFACLSMAVATVDISNTTASRYADKIAVGDEIGKSRLREYGRHFARLRISDSASFVGTLGTIPTSWKMWIAGGQSTLLMRMPSGADSPSACLTDGQVLIKAANGDDVVAESTIPSAALCNQWQRIDIRFPRGVTALQLEMPATVEESGRSVDVMLISHEALLPWLWRLCSALALTLLIAAVYLFSASTLDRLTPQSPKPGATKHNRVFSSLAVVVFIIVGNAFVYSYVTQERTIYTWDFSGSWMSSVNVSEFLGGAERKSASKSPESTQSVTGAPRSGEPGKSAPDPGALAALIRNFRYAEYNVSSSLPVAPVLAAFGGSRLVYEHALLNVYALAAVILLIIVLGAVRNSAAQRWPSWWPLVPVACVFCFIPFWVPILRGYIGISTVAINLAVLWLYLRQPTERMGTPTMVAIGILLVAGVILQRWNAFWVVSFCVVMALDSVRSIAQATSINVSAVLRAFRVPAVVGFVAFFLFVSLAWPKVVTTLTTNYADIYSSFLEDDGYLEVIVRLINRFGGGLAAIIALAYVALAVDLKTRRIAVLLGIQLIVMVIHFSGTQTFGPHHMYILMPGLLIILSLGLIKAMSSFRPKVRWLGIGGSVLVLLSGYASGMAVFAPDGPPHLLPRSVKLLSQSYRPPLVRNDLDEFVRLAAYIDNAFENDASIYVAAGSQTLNAAHFKNVGASADIDFRYSENILSSPVIDKRDGFPHQLLRADYVVTTDPVQFSRDPADQQVIRIPVESLSAGEGIGAAFTLLPDRFQLDGDVEVQIYRRNRPNSEEEILDLSSKLRVFYPDRPDVFQYRQD